jgi:iron complex outermembrane receptor protein
MRKILTLVGFVGFSIFTWAQVADSIKVWPEIVHLEEVNVAANFPLNNNNVVDFYRTNHFATLDNINGRLDGMSLIKRGAYAQEPQLNGFSGGQLNVTIDGMKMFGACTDKMDPITSYIEPTNLQNISISHGTSGSQNGSNIGGSFDMSLREPELNLNNPFHTSIGLGYESVSQSRNILFSTGYGKQKWAFGFDGVYRKNENYRDGNKNEISFSQFQKTNLHSVVSYTPNAIHSFKFDVLYDDAQNVGYPALPMDVGLARSSLFALEYRNKSKTPLKAKLYFNTVHHVMDDSKRDSMYLLENSSANSDTVYMRMDMPGKSSTIGAYVQLIIPWHQNNKLTIKADNFTNNSIAEMTMHMRYESYAPESPMYMQTWPAMLRNVTGLFVQNTTFVSHNLVLWVDTRIDFNTDMLQSEYGQQQFSIFNYDLDVKQNNFVKSINASSRFNFTKSLSTLATVGYAERIPTIGERLGFYLYNAYDGYDYIGNPYLQNENSNFFRLEFSLSKPLLKINLSQSVSLISNYIMGETDTLIPSLNFYTNGTRVYKNIPNATLFSTDLQILYNPIEDLSVFTSSKLTLGEIREGETMPLISPLNTILALKYQKNNFMMQAECENALAQNRINLNYGEQKTPGFTIFNIKGGYIFKLNKSTVDASLGITNILNKAYYAHLDWGRIYRPGRSVEVYVKYSY